MRGLAALALAALASTPIIAGSDISFAPGTDFSTLRTFSIREGVISSDKLEINNRLFRQRLESGIRATLLKKGLRETSDKPDVWVTYSVRDKDVRAVERRGPTRLPGGPGGRNGGGAPDIVVPAPAATPRLYTEGVLVVDLVTGADSLLWRGTFEDRAASSPQLSRQLSEDARKLLAGYPPRKR